MNAASVDRGIPYARRPVIDADSGDSLPPISAAIGLVRSCIAHVEAAGVSAGSPSGAPARSSGLPEGAAGTSVFVFARDVAFEKREAEGRQSSAPADCISHVVHQDRDTSTLLPERHPWALWRIWAIAINTATIRSHRSSCERAGTHDIGCVCFLTKEQDFRQSIARAPPEALAPAPDLVPMMPPEPPLICRTALMCPSQAQRAFSQKLARMLGRAPRQDLIRT